MGELAERGLPEADFALYIDFVKDQPRPERIFQATDEMIRAFRDFDRMLINGIDPNIEPILLLEDVEAGSLKVWLRNRLQSADDQALKEFDWKPQIGQYVVKAKYLAIDYLNKRISIESAQVERARLEQLRQDLRKLASDTDVRRFPDYAPAPVPELARNLSKMASARAKLAPRDEMKYITHDDQATFNIVLEWSPESLEELLVRDVFSHPPLQMILAVKRPDYIGASQWELRHGKQAVFARIDDSSWLRKFHTRRIDLRPGDALRCMVQTEVRYGYDNEVISQKWVITEVLEVLENRLSQAELLEVNNDDAKGSSSSEQA